MLKIWLIMLLLMIPLMGDIDELIESMQLVSDEERFKLMNQFKAEVIKLQEKERMEAMMKVILITDSNHTQEVLEEAKDSLTKKEIENIDHAIETHDIVSIQGYIEEEVESNEVEDEDDD